MDLVINTQVHAKISRTCRTEHQITVSHLSNTYLVGTALVRGCGHKLRRRPTQDAPVAHVELLRGGVRPNYLAVAVEENGPGVELLAVRHHDGVRLVDDDKVHDGAEGMSRRQRHVVECLAANSHSIVRRHFYNTLVGTILPLACIPSPTSNVESE